MNQGSESGRDDDGLPQVDVEIPDDARELYRDVLAYQRELRALRRQSRRQRLRAPLYRNGVVLPLVVGFVLLAMVSGVLLTVFTSSSYLGGPVSQPTRHATHPGRAASPGGGAATTGPVAGQRPAGLPNGKILVHGQSIALDTITDAVLALAPANCRCAAVVRQLAVEARQAKVGMYLVGAPGGTRELTVLAGPAAARGTIQLATDSAGVLRRTYQSVPGLTVVLVDSSGSAWPVRLAKPGFRLEQRLLRLAPAG